MKNLRHSSPEGMLRICVENLNQIFILHGYSEILVQNIKSAKINFEFLAFISFT